MSTERLQQLLLPPHPAPMLARDKWTGLDTSALT